MVAAAADAAAVALNKTPEQLDVLASAGVVDAGGFGLVLILDAFVEVLTGEAAGSRRSGDAGPEVERSCRRQRIRSRLGSQEPDRMW